MKVMKKWNELSTEQKEKVKEVKSHLLCVNDKWNRNSEWQLLQNLQIDPKTLNPFIDSLLDSLFIKGRLSEKQAFYLALFLVTTDQYNF